MKHTLISGLLIWGMALSAAAQADALDVKVCNHYKFRTDRAAGREIILGYHGGEDLSGATVEIQSRQGMETTTLQEATPEAISILLPPQIGVEHDDTVTATLRTADTTVSCRVTVPAMRQWTVYIYPHSHVDIGYTNTQENVEFIHKRNLDVAMDLAEKTKDYPVDARFRWNPEVTWPIERYLATETPAKAKRLMQAIRKGHIVVDAGYINTNTSCNSDEELLQLFSFAKKLEKETQRPVQTMVQVDIPGVSWGVVQAAAQSGVKYCLSLFNGYDRTGLSPEMSFKPFWWTGADGKSKVLFLQPGAYTPGALAKGWKFRPKLAGQLDQSKLLPVVKTDNPRECFIDSYLADILPRLEKDKDYPYDIFPMTWCMADNTPIDADLPDAVRSWNEEFAFLHLKICTATEMMQAFEKYGDRLPTLQGDYTEYWTDGLGSSAAKTGESREVKDRLVQAQILWSMLHPGKEEPTELIQEAWRHIILSTEHTWAYMAPDQQPLSDEILAAKLGYFDKARELTSQVMDKTLAPIEDRTSDIVSVFNTNTWAQSGIVTLPRETVGDYRSIQDAEGREVPCQMLTTGEMAFMAEQVPALGHKTFRLRSEEARTAGIPDGPANVLDNGMVRLVLNPVTGDVASLTYRGEEFVDQEALTAINSFRYLEGGNASSAAVKDTDIEITVGERGPLINSLIVRSKARGCNSLTREVRLIKGSAGVELYNVVDKQAIVAKEGIHFGFAFNVPQGQVRVNIPWGVMELEKDQLKAGNRNWIALQRWLDVSNADKGVTWCSMNACTFESGDITANIIGGANGSPKWIRQLQPSSTIYSWALNNHWHTNFRLSQDGLIGYKYRLLPHVGAYDVVRSHRYAMEQYRPLVAVQIGKGFHTAGSLSLTGSDMVALSNYRTVDRGRTNVVRLLSMSDKAEHVSLQWSGKQPRAISYTEDGKAVKVPVKGHSIEVPAKGILTLNIAW